MNILIFNGGRGASTILKNIKRYKSIKITSVVNAYDDGKSSGDIRKNFNMLGPSDIRKVQATLIDEKMKNHIDFFNYRLPNLEKNYSALNILDNLENFIKDKFNLDNVIIQDLLKYKKSFLKVINNNPSGHIFSFNDCSLINCLYAGGYIYNQRDFLKTIKKFKNLFNIKHDVVINSCDNLKMIAIREDGQVLFSESEIVNLRSNVKIHSIFLIKQDILLDIKKIINLNFYEKINFFKKLNIYPNINQELINKILSADIIIFAPGTQHSSLLPTFLTKNIGDLIVSNKRALKVFITNIGADYENPVYIASDYVNNATKYLNMSSKISHKSLFYFNYILVNHNNYIDQNKVHYDRKGMERLNINYLANDFEDKNLRGNHNGELLIETIFKEYKRIN